MNAPNRSQIPTRDGSYPSAYPDAFKTSSAERVRERPHAPRSFSLDSVSSYSDMGDWSPVMSNQERSSQRPRRRHQPGMQHVKHRRTRSGCYTCRQRRIKCDEGRPICDRMSCQKGKRECNYPGGPSSSVKKSPTSASKGSRSGHDSDRSGSEPITTVMEESPVLDSNDDAFAVDDTETPSLSALDTTFDSPTTSESTLPRPSVAATPTMSLRTEDTRGFRQDSHHTINAGVAQSPRWLSLSSDVRFLLAYHRDNLSYHHYAFRYEPPNFLKTIFPNIAMDDESEALLYAIVAYAAYHYTLASGDTEIANFLSYYDKSIVLLQQSLKCKAPDMTTLLTVLQLATIEECLGDWVTMAGHQKAAHRIITDLFTPQTVSRDETALLVVSWYKRFDLFNAFLCNGNVNLGREWFINHREVYKQRAKDNPGNLTAKLDEYCTIFNLLTADLSAFMAETSHGKPMTNAIRLHGKELEARFAEFSNELERAYAELLSSSAGASSSIALGQGLQYARAAPRETRPLTLRYLLLDFWAVDLMHRHHVLKQPATQLAGLALRVCETMQAIASDPSEPPCAILSCRGSLTVASYFLPHEPTYIDWARRKFASIEQFGWMYPLAARGRMFAMWGIDESENWLPNGESTSPIIYVLRDFIQGRMNTASFTTEMPPRLATESMMGMSLG